MLGPPPQSTVQGVSPLPPIQVLPSPTARP